MTAALLAPAAARFGHGVTRPPGPSGSESIRPSCVQQAVASIEAFLRSLICHISSHVHLNTLADKPCAVCLADSPAAQSLSTDAEQKSDAYNLMMLPGLQGAVLAPPVLPVTASQLAELYNFRCGLKALQAPSSSKKHMPEAQQLQQP